MGRHNEAIQVLTNNLSEATPANMRRDALMKVVDLQIEQGLDHDAIAGRVAVETILRTS